MSDQAPSRRTGATPDSGLDLTQISHSLGQARDQQITQVVAMVDALAVRGPADALIAPLRPRLARLRPTRPLGFCRLLFTPFDPVIVAPRGWRSGDPTIPRSVLLPIAATVTRILGPDATALDPACVRLAEDGARLWPAAARILATPPPPENWDSTGLPIAAYPALARAISAILRQALPLTALSEAGTAPIAAPVIDSLISQVRADDPDAVPMLIAILLARAPQAAVALAQTGDRSADLLLDHLESRDADTAGISVCPLPEAHAVLRAQATALRALDTAAAPSGRRARVRALRQNLDRVSRLRFAQALEDELLLPIRATGPDPAPGSGTRMETVARALRELEQEARSLGGAEVYDRLLRQAADAVRDCGRDGGMSRMDTIRLVEILAGSAAALALL